MEQISTILDYIDNGHMALPEFQRGYVWKGNQVRRFFDTLYKRHPIGNILVWSTDPKETRSRGSEKSALNMVKLILDGQQRITSLYGVIRGKPPSFFEFEGDAGSFQDLMFNLETEVFQFFQTSKMKNNPLWVDVTEVMKKGSDATTEVTNELLKDTNLQPQIGLFTNRLARLLGIKDIQLHIEQISGQDKTVEIVVDIFNRANSSGTTLSKGDLAMAKICADWPDARDEMRNKLNELKSYDYSFKLDWLLRSVNTVLTGEAKFHFLDDCSAEEIQDGLARASKYVDQCLNLISSKLGLDHDRVLFAKLAIPVMVRYLDQRNGTLNDDEIGKLLFWFVQVGIWGRFSGPTETNINTDIKALSDGNSGLNPLLEKLRLWRVGNMKVDPGQFNSSTVGARFYSVLYMLTRVGGACDWGTGIELKAGMLGKMSKLEVHHIFPKSLLGKKGYKGPQVNALGNFCFQTKNTNLKISNRSPEDYFPEIEASHPGALASQWIPNDPKLWKIDNYLDFLEERRKLLAKAANALLTELLHGETHWLEDSPTIPQEGSSDVSDETSVTPDIDKDEVLQGIKDWVHTQGLMEGMLFYEHSDPESGQPLAVLDLVWPDGIQEGLSQPVAVLLNEPPEVLATANQAGYRCFTSKSDFQDYVRREILVEEETE